MKNILVILITSTTFFFLSTSVASAQSVPRLDFVKDTDGTDFETGYSTQIDADGNIYASGYFEGNVDFDTTNVVSGDTHTSAGSTDIFLVKYNSSGVLQWVKAIGGTGLDLGNDIILDDDGNIYMTGIFAGSVDFDEDNVVSGDTATTSGAFVVKYNNNGVLQWLHTPDAGEGYSVELDGAGNVIIAGRYSGSIDLDENAVTSGDSHTSNGNTDIFIAKYDSNGDYVNSQSVGSTSVDNSLGLGVNLTGDIYVGGVFTGTVDFEPDSAVAGDTPVSAGSQDFFVARYNSNLDLQWVNAIGSTGQESLRGLAIDGNNNVFVTGRYTGTVDFDEDNVTSGDTHSSIGSTDMFFAKYNSSGTFQWVKAIGSTDVEEGYDVAVDNVGFVYFTGYFSLTTDFDEDVTFSGDTKTAIGAYDIFLARYSNDGTISWVKTAGKTSGTTIGWGVDADDVDQIALTGEHFDPGTMDFDQDYEVNGDSISNSNFNTDLIVAKYSPVTLALGESMRIVLRDSELAGQVTDTEIWFNIVDVETNSRIQISYDTNHTGGSAITTSDITVTCDADGVDPLSGVTMTGATVIDSANGFLEIDTGASSCADYTVVDIHGDGGNSLTNPAQPGNYSWSVAVDNGADTTVDGNGATLAYVQDENDITIEALVQPVLDMELYETNVDTLLNGTGANTCELGVLSINTISTCTYDIGTGTNNPSGVSVYIQSDGDLRDGSGNTIDACSGTNCDSLGGAGVSVGEEEYGIYISELGGGEYTPGGSFGTQHQGIPTTEILFATSSTTGSGTAAGSVSQRLEVTHAASISTATTQGSYSHIVTYTAFTN